MGYFPTALKHHTLAISLSILFFFCGFYTTFSPLLLGFLALFFSTSFSLFRKITQTMDSLENISAENNVRQQQIEENHEGNEEMDEGFHEKKEENGEENEEIHEVETQESSIESSDESISDDESLIEIYLPDGTHIENDSNSFFEQGFKGESIWDFLPESVFNQTGLTELLKEINEEDNLIELDISRGSVKCSNLRIMA